MAKADLEEMGESTDGLADSSSKMREELLGLTGVDIMLDENTFKSTAQIIQEIGENWSKMTDASQAAALELMAGKNRASTVAGLIENYETIAEVIEAAENAEGSALEENEKYLDSIDGKMQQLSNQAQEFWFKLIDSETIKGGVDFLTDFLEIITKIVDATDGLALPGLLGGGLAVFLGKDKLKKQFCPIWWRHHIATPSKIKMGVKLTGIV